MNKKQEALLRKLQEKPRYRNLTIRTEHLGDEEDGTGKIKFSASSTEPVETFIITDDFMGRAFEVLSMDPKTIDLKRLRDGGHLLLDHNSMGLDTNLGRIRSATADGERLNVDVEFNPHNPDSGRVEAEMKSGFRPNVSIGFNRDNTSGHMTGEKDGVPVFEFNIEVFEISSVLIPADPTVGVGRSIEELLYRELGLDKDDEAHQKIATTLLEEMESRSDEENDDNTTTDLLMADDSETRSAELEADDSFGEKTMSEKQTDNTNESAPETPAVGHVGVDLDAARASATEEAVARAEFCKERKYPQLSERAMKESWTEERMRSEMFKLGETKREVETLPESNMDEQQVKELNLSKAVRSYVVDDEDSEVGELGREVAKAHGIAVRRDSLYIPLNVPLLSRKANPQAYTRAQRALATSPSAQGGALVGTDFLALAPSLFEASVAAKVGVQFDSATNLQQIPRFLTNQPASWVGEGSSITLDSGSFATVTATPNQLVSAVPMTPMLGTALMGSYNPVDAVLENIVRQLNDEVERAIFQGGGGVAPTGILNDSDITEVTEATASVDLYADLWEAVRDNDWSPDGPFLVSTDVYRRGIERAALTSGVDVATIMHDQTGQFSGVVSLGKVQETQFLPAQSAIYGSFNQVRAFNFGVMELRRDISVRSLSGEDVLFGRLFFDMVVQQPGALAIASGTIDITS